MQQTRTLQRAACVWVCVCVPVTFWTLAYTPMATINKEKIWGQRAICDIPAKVKKIITVTVWSQLGQTLTAQIYCQTQELKLNCCFPQPKWGLVKKGGVQPVK